MISDDTTLVSEYARTHSEEVFRQLVSQYVNLVFSVALRQTHDPHLAEEVTQAVFLVLARKAGAISTTTPISGWLCRTARHIAANALRAERRRQIREQEAFMRTSEKEVDPWLQIEPLLEMALAQLNHKDHDVIVMHYLEGKKLDEVALALGSSGNAAKTRVSRALEKLRRFFARHGVAIPIAAIAGAISAHSVQAAPAGLAATIIAAAVIPGASIGGSTLALVNGALSFMAWAKTKTIIAICAGALLAGTATKMVWPAREPVYQGKSVSAWIAELYADKDLTAHFALVEMGDPAVPYLVRELKRDNHPAHRGNVAYVLNDIGPRAWPAVPWLIPSLSRPAYQPEQFSAVTALGSIGLAASNAVPFLVQTLSAEDFNVRMQAALALAKIGLSTPNAVAQLTTLLDEPRPRVSAAAALALWRLQPGDPAAFDRIKELVLRNPEKDVRSSVAFDLGDFGAAARVFIPILKDALKDSETRVQECAQRSLQKLSLIP